MNNIPQKRDIINLTQLQSDTGNNQAVISRVVKLFLSDTPGYFSDINRLINIDDWENIKTIIHKFKPSFGYLGLSEIYNILSDIENSALEQEFRKENKLKLENIAGRMPLIYEQLSGNFE